VSVVVGFALPAEVGGLPEAWYLVVFGFGGLFSFMLALKLYGIGLGIFFGALALVPLLGIFVLLGINGKASHVLRSNGVKVGLFGVRFSDLI
ncbi:MAG: hypothetical protein AAF664_11375, partial [Planctomycetota bacterium]